MQAYNALVKNGRLTLDTPTDLPDGQVVVLLPFDEIVALATDQLGDQDDVGYAFAPPRQWRATRHVDARSLIDELRAM